MERPTMVLLILYQSSSGVKVISIEEEDIKKLAADT